MANESKTVIIEEIIKQIEKGQDRGKLLATIGKKWQLSQRTFDRHWKTAQQWHSERNKARQKKLEDDKTLKELNARKDALMSAIERKELLVKQIRRIEKLIASGKTPDYIRRPTKFINPRMHRNLTAIETASLSESCKSLITELNKMEGDYAPDKVANVTADGQDVTPIQLLSDNQFSQLIKSINEASAG